MRDILNLSLPAKTAEKIKIKAKVRGFVNTSSYIRFLLDLDDDLISPNSLLDMAKKADREYRQGKIKKYTSLSKLF